MNQQKQIREFDLSDEEFSFSTESVAAVYVTERQCAETLAYLEKLDHQRGTYDPTFNSFSEEKILLLKTLKRPWRKTRI